MRRVASLVCVGALLALLRVTPGSAEEAAYQTTFVSLAPSVPGVLYQPRAASEKSQIGLLFMHAFDSY